MEPAGPRWRRLAVWAASSESAQRDFGFSPFYYGADLTPMREAASRAPSDGNDRLQEPDVWLASGERNWAAGTVPAGLYWVEEIGMDEPAAGVAAGNFPLIPFAGESHDIEAG